VQNTARRLPFRDPAAQLRALYMDLLRNQSHFDEFRHLLALYHPADVNGEKESSRANEVRERLNDRIRAWLGADIDDLTPSQVLQWRAVVVEERFSGTRDAFRFGAP